MNHLLMSAKIGIKIIKQTRDYWDLEEKNLHLKIHYHELRQQTNIHTHEQILTGLYVFVYHKQRNQTG